MVRRGTSAIQWPEQAFEDVDGVELAAVYVPCFELGGDFYDFIPLPYDNVGLVIADVAGKGVPASLIMAAVRASLRAQVDNVYYLYEVMRRINLMVHRDTRPGACPGASGVVPDRGAQARRLVRARDFAEAGKPHRHACL